MKPQEKEKNAEKAIQELVKHDDLIKIPEHSAVSLAKFYETRSISRLETAKLIYRASIATKKEYGIAEKYADHSEVVSAAYYAMYYIVHAYLAHAYRTKLKEGLRGVHAITNNIVLFYLVKTKKLAQHLYDEYVKTLKTTSELQHISTDTFQEEAHAFAKKYDTAREARETFTYKTTVTVESRHAESTLTVAEEFIDTVRRLIK